MWGRSLRETRETAEWRYKEEENGDEQIWAAPNTYGLSVHPFLAITWDVLHFGPCIFASGPL